MSDIVIFESEGRSVEVHLDAIAKIRRIKARGDLTQDDVLYDAVLRNLQTLSEATQLLPEDKNQRLPQYSCTQLSRRN